MNEQTEAILFYCGVCEGQWNRGAWGHGSYVCIGNAKENERGLWASI